jgi:hypothetical protein
MTSRTPSRVSGPFRASRRPAARGAFSRQRAVGSVDVQTEGLT